MKSPIYFTEFDKIQDTIMWFTKDYSLKFCVPLKKVVRGDSNETRSFHAEYFSINGSREYLTISRTYSPFFTIDCRGDFNKTVTLFPKDIEMLQMTIKANIYPWFVGAKRIFKKEDQTGAMIISGKFNKVEFPINGMNYIKFEPIIILYDTNEAKEGVRLEINDPENFFDITIDKFLEFAYYIIHTDMMTAAATLLNYVKIAPYDVNLKDLSSSGYNNNSRNNFFNNI